MFKQIIKVIWAQRLSNIWIFLELLIVVGVIWWMMDTLYINNKIYREPMGFDIENTFKLNLGILSDIAPDYIPEGQLTTTPEEDLSRLIDNLKLHPAIEEIALSQHSTPYVGTTTYIGLEVPGEDPEEEKSSTFLYKMVTPSFFSVFRIKDKDGNLLAPQIEEFTSGYVFSADLSRYFFGTEDAKGKIFRMINGENDLLIMNISESIRSNEYRKSEPFLYRVIGKNSFTDAFIIRPFSAPFLELSIRMKKATTNEEMDQLLKDMGDRLMVNNVYVYGYESYAKRRIDMIKNRQDAEKTNISFMVFLLVNVFFGIIGTFWLRTQYRKGEIGVRIALGATKTGIFKQINQEGLVLLLLTLPFILVLGFNLLYFDMYPTNQVDISIGRFIFTLLFTYFLVAGMIFLGIFFPARKALQESPATALHYE